MIQNLTKPSLRPPYTSENVRKELQEGIKSDAKDFFMTRSLINWENMTCMNTDTKVPAFISQNGWPLQYLII